MAGRMLEREGEMKEGRGRGKESERLRNDGINIVMMMDGGVRR